jgi:hypothetical protein
MSLTNYCIVELPQNTIDVHLFNIKVFTFKILLLKVEIIVHQYLKFGNIG